jgi:hypothetical protein
MNADPKYTQVEITPAIGLPAIKLYECVKCKALVIKESREEHTAWHEALRLAIFRDRSRVE